MPMKYIITNEIKNNETLRRSFNNLANQTFNIDFETWFQRGYWGNTYTCHSITKDNQVLSNVSTTEMLLSVNGKRLNAVQIGTVMTLPEYRKMGLASELLTMIMSQFESKSDLIFLFPNESVMSFYPKFGLDLLNDYKYSIAIRSAKLTKLTLEKLNIENQNDLNRIYNYAKKRIPLSSKFEVVNSESILMWYCINVFSHSIYYAKEYDCIIIFDITERVNIFFIYKSVAIL